MTTPKIIAILFLLLLLSCTNKKKEKLWETFNWAQMRQIPIDKAIFTNVNKFDVVYQNPKTLDNSWNYPNRYVVGLYNKSKGDYDRIHYIKGFNALDNYALIKSISDFYTSDTTYLEDIQLTDTINKMNSKKYIVLIYRKTNPLKREKTTGEFMMWKREIVQFQNDSLKTETFQKMNEHLF